MCVSVEVILPTLDRFLMLYSLRCGSIIVFFWTLIRSLFCVFFFSSAILEVLIGRESLFGGRLALDKQDTEYIYAVYYILIILLLCDSMVFIYNMIHLAFGLFRYEIHLLEHFLLCRLLTWLIELIGLFVLCVIHKLLIGWYLGILFFVVLETYCYIVIYSYYVQLNGEEKEF